jgi:hypothetical protein
MNNFRNIHTKKIRNPEEIQKLGNKVLNYVIGKWGNNIKNIICKNDANCTYHNCKFFHPSKNNNDSNKILKKNLMTIIMKTKKETREYLIHLNIIITILET